MLTILEYILRLIQRMIYIVTFLTRSQPLQYPGINYS